MIIINDTDNDKYDILLEKARAIIIDENRSIYVCNINDSYFLPGGTVEKDEDPNVTIIRELKEEMGLENIKPQFLVQIHYYHDDFPKRNSDQFEKRLNIVNYYILNINSKDIGNSKFTDYEINNNMHINKYQLKELDNIIQNHKMIDKYSKHTIKELKIILEEYKRVSI